MGLGTALGLGAATALLLFSARRSSSSAASKAPAPRAPKQLPPPRAAATPPKPAAARGELAPAPTPARVQPASPQSPQELPLHPAPLKEEWLPRGETIVIDKPRVVEPAPRSATLKKGSAYEADLRLTGLQALASNEQVVAEIQKAVGPWSQTRATGDGALRTVTGVYTGPTREVTLPPAVVRFKAVTAPKAAPKPPPVKVTIGPAVITKPASKPAATPAALPPAPKPEPPKRSPEAAARELYDYARSKLAAGKGADLGVKNKPSAFVRAAQQDMGGITADGQYGPATRTRGQKLTGLTFPIRK